MIGQTSLGRVAVVAFPLYPQCEARFGHNCVERIMRKWYTFRTREDLIDADYSNERFKRYQRPV